MLKKGAFLLQLSVQYPRVVQTDLHTINKYWPVPLSISYTRAVSSYRLVHLISSTHTFIISLKQFRSRHTDILCSLFWPSFRCSNWFCTLKIWTNSNWTVITPSYYFNTTVLLYKTFVIPFGLFFLCQFSWKVGNLVTYWPLVFLCNQYLLCLGVS